MVKNEIRSAVKRQLKAFSVDEVRSFSASIAERLFAFHVWREAQDVLAFMSMKGEVDTRPIIERALRSGKRVFMPRVEGESIVFHNIQQLSQVCVPHSYGMLEPEPSLPRLRLPPSEAKMLILVPGLAFDRRKNRLGRGKGCYDRFLEQLTSCANRDSIFILGIGFHQQLYAAVPHTRRDVKMDAVLTDMEFVA